MVAPHDGGALVPRVLVGPVVGLVTETSARILFEFDKDAEVTLLVLAEDGAEKVVTRRFRGELPGCIVVDGLSPDSRYTFEVKGDVSKGSFKTQSGDASRPSRVVVCSCDKGVERRGPKDMYKTLYAEIKKGAVDMVVRNGDQVYADSAFADCLKFLETQGMAVVQREKLMLTLYQEVYRRTWGAPTAARCYANASHVMLLDDHEIRNDWGTFEHDDEVGHAEYTAGMVGRWAYYLYQRQLWDAEVSEDNYKEYAPATEGGVFRVGGTGVVIVDSRGSRSWNRVEGGDVAKGVVKGWLGKRQWDQLEAALAPGGALGSAKSLVLVHSTPPVYLSKGASRRVARCFKPQQDKMGFGLYSAEQARYLDALHDWGLKNNSEVTLVGGDLHHSMYTEIFKPSRAGARKVIRQVVASPLSNNPPPKPISACLRCCCLGGTLALGGDWRAEHSQLRYERNFLKVTSNGNRVTLVVHTAGHPSGVLLNHDDG